MGVYRGNHHLLVDLLEDLQRSVEVFDCLIQIPLLGVRFCCVGETVGLDGDVTNLLRDFDALLMRFNGLVHVTGVEIRGPKSCVDLCHLAQIPDILEQH